MKKIFSFIIVVLVLLLVITPVIGVAAQSPSGNTGTSKKNAGGATSSPGTSRDSTAARMITSGTTYGELVRQLELYTTGNTSNPVMANLVLQEILMFAEKECFADKVPVNSTASGVAWAVEVADQATGVTNPSIQSIMEEYYGPIGGDNPGKLFEAQSSELVKYYLAEAETNLEEAVDNTLFGSVGFWFKKLWDKDAHSIQQAYNYWDEVSELFVTSFQESNKVDLDAVLMDIDKTTHPDYWSMSAYRILGSQAIQNQQFGYIALLAHEAIPTIASLNDDSVAQFNEGDHITIEKLDIDKNPQIRELLGIEDGVMAADLDAGLVESFNAQNFKYKNLSFNEELEESNSNLLEPEDFSIIGWFGTGDDGDKMKVAYGYTKSFNEAVPQTTSTQYLPDHVAEILTFVDRAPVILDEYAKSGYAYGTSGAKTTQKLGPFVFADKSLYNMMQSFKTFGDGEYTSLGIVGTLHWKKVAPHAIDTITFYKWYQELADEAFADELDDYKKESERKIDVDPSLLANFIKQTETDPEWHLTENMVRGISMSALYMPLQTNINTFDYGAIAESANFQTFQEKYGALRKVVLISEAADSVTSYERAGQIGHLRVATLKDLIEKPNNDKLLVVQTAYYNRDKINLENMLMSGRYTAPGSGTNLGNVSVAPQKISDVAKPLGPAEPVQLSSLLTNVAATTESEEEESVDSNPTEIKGEEAKEDLSTPAPEDSAKDNQVSAANEDEFLKNQYPELYDRSFILSFNEWQENGFSFSKEMSQHSLKVTSSTDFKKFVDEMVASDDMLISGVNVYSGLNIINSMVRDKDLIGILNSSKQSNAPIYMSTSRSIDDVPDGSYYNYLQLCNIQKNSAIRYSTNLDYDSPLFVDIYGNILTESGIVVIPAASNATLAEGNRVNWLTVANLLNYGNDKHIERTRNYDTAIDGKEVDLWQTSYADVAAYLPMAEASGDTTVYKYDESLKRYYINPVIVPVDGIAINISSLNTGDKESLTSLYKINRAMYDKSVNKDISFNLNKWIGSILPEVMKGAKISGISYTKEGIRPAKQWTQGQLSQAAKFEEFYNNTVTEHMNTTLSIPNPMYIKGVEYVIFFLFRLMLIGTTFAVSVHIYRSAAKGKLTILAFGKILLNLAIVVMIVMAIPTVFDLTYYQSNKVLLKDEARMISGLNLEKENSGIELGILTAERSDPKSKTFIHIDDVDISWFKLTRDIIANPKVTHMQEIYDAEITALPSVSSQFETKGSRIYLDTNKLFESSDIQTTPEGHQLRQVVRPEPDASFYLPYYAIIDYLCYNINTYNATVRSYNYDLFTYGDGRDRSVGLAKDYFLSDAFLITAKDIANPKFEISPNANDVVLSLASHDKIGVYQYYDVTSADDRTIFLNKDGFKLSQWYREGLKDKDIADRVTNLDKKAVNYVLNNHELLGRVSDETFIKLMAMDLALEYNKEFRSGGPTSLEIFNLDSDDLMRLSIAKKEDVMIMSPFNFAKFLLETGGVPNVIVGSILSMVMLAQSYVKPIVTTLVMLLVMLTVFIYKCLLNKETSSLKGVAGISIALATSNVLYALLLKLSLLIPATGIPPFICVVFQILLQGAYTYFYVWLFMLVLRNWRDLGASSFSNIIKLKTLKLGTISVDNWKGAPQEVIVSDSTPRRRRRENGWDYYNELHNKDKNKPSGPDDDDMFN